MCDVWRNATPRAPNDDIMVLWKGAIIVDAIMDKGHCEMSFTEGSIGRINVESDKGGATQSLN